MRIERTNVNDKCRRVAIENKATVGREGTFCR